MTHICFDACALGTTAAAVTAAFRPNRISERRIVVVVERASLHGRTADDPAPRITRAASDVRARRARRRQRRRFGVARSRGVRVERRRVARRAEVRRRGRRRDRGAAGLCFGAALLATGKDRQSIRTTRRYADENAHDDSPPSPICDHRVRGDP